MHCFFCCSPAFEAKTVSPWHEIPLYAGDGNLHYICEIPKETTAKMEVATVRGVNQQIIQKDSLRSTWAEPSPPPFLPQDKECTPIEQDVKDKELRYYPFPIHWNYGLLPQTGPAEISMPSFLWRADEDALLLSSSVATWEDPELKDQRLGVGVSGTCQPLWRSKCCSKAGPALGIGSLGDNDPVDVVEISSKAHQQGGVYKVSFHTTCFCVVLPDMLCHKQQLLRAPSWIKRSAYKHAAYKDAVILPSLMLMEKGHANLPQSPQESSTPQLLPLKEASVLRPPTQPISQLNPEYSDKDMNDTPESPQRTPKE
eukprot:scaffold203543_cov19-Tisochrysis_lutea.AAC.1